MSSREGPRERWYTERGEKVDALADAILRRIDAERAAQAIVEDIEKNPELSVELPSGPKPGTVRAMRARPPCVTSYDTKVGMSYGTLGMNDRQAIGESANVEKAPDSEKDGDE